MFQFDLYNAGREETIQFIKVCISVFVLNYDHFTKEEIDSFTNFYNSIVW